MVMIEYLTKTHHYRLRQRSKPPGKWMWVWQSRKWRDW